MDLSTANLKNLPQLANRPNFPQGLQVLLLDPDFHARSEAEALLNGYAYSVALCSSSAEAAAYLSNPEHAVDVLLLDVKCLQQKTAENATLIAAAKLLPLVLMAEGSDPSEVMLGIKLGAVDFLEKPLNPLKLKNIWTHTVRRIMGAPSGTNNLHLMKKGAHPQQLQHLVNQQQAAAAVFHQQQQQGGAHVAGQDMFQNSCVSAVPLAAFAASFIPLPGSPEDSSAGSHGSGGESGSNASTSDRAHVKAELDMDIETSSFQDIPGGSMLMGSTDALNLALSPHAVDAMDCDAPATSNTSTKQVRSSRSKSAARQSTPGNTATTSPAIGYPAGQMPALPNVQGIEWGLPTNPLQISPKGPNPMGSMMGPIGSWPLGSVMPNSLFPSFLFNPASLGGSPMGGSLGHLGSASMSTVASAGSLLNLPAVSSISAPQMSTSSLMKRADSAPPSLVIMDQFMPPPAAKPAATDLFSSVDTTKPTLGLQLKKSPSLVDFISQSLKQGSSSPAS